MTSTDEFECAGCGAFPHELCCCRVREDRTPSAEQLEEARQLRLTRAERTLERACGR